MSDHTFDLINTEIIGVEREMARIWARSASVPVPKLSDTAMLSFSYRGDAGWKLMQRVMC